MLAAMSVGCINTDAAVFIEASFSNAALTVESSSLAVGLSGSATLSLHLGPRAAGPSTARLLSLSLLDATGTTTLASSLGFESSPVQPVTIGLDETVDLSLTLSATDNTLESGAMSSLCAGPVRLRTVIDDSLRGASILAESEPFELMNCN